ncbi:MAG: large conductance mechanosensitive channel protein MscL [Candidatus Vecturithrix sp.]|nr:large conductance mechanosensitive channel protein MscL [Candidatus Vecturithrix sp.]
MDVKKSGVSFFEEFKKFALKGNVIDLAVAVVMGGAFGKIVDSLVKDIIMPLVSLVMPGEQGYLNWKLVVGQKEIPYGLFIGEVVNFVIVALAIFIVIVKVLGWLTKKKAAPEEEKPAAPEFTKDQELLIEIRDLLKQKGA